MANSTVMICRFTGCLRKVYAFGHCNPHYQQERRVGADAMFAIIERGRDKDCEFEGCWRKRSSGIHCQTHHGMLKSGESLRPIQERTPQKGNVCAIPGCNGKSFCKGICTEHRNASRFNLTIDQIERLFTNPRCHICSKVDNGGRNFDIDHDHTCCKDSEGSCGKCVRGLLCRSCNHALGFFKDDTDLLAKAIAYLRGDRPYRT